MSTTEDQTEFKELYLKLTREHLKALEERLPKLKENPNDKKVLEESRHHAHDIKGESFALDYNKTAYLAHAVEDVFRGAGEGKIKLDQKLFDLLAASFKDLAHSIDGIEKENKELDLSLQAEHLKAKTGTTTSKPTE